MLGDSPTTMRAALSFVALQAGWFACVLGAAKGWPWLGPVFVAALLFVHLRGRQAHARRAEAAVLALSALMGFAIDTALLQAGTLVLPGASVSPPWLVALWPNFAAATAAGGSLRSFARRPIAAALLGAVAAPLAYDGGSRMGALTLGEPRATSWLTLAVVWLFVLPLLFAVRAQIGGPDDSRRKV